MSMVMSKSPGSRPNSSLPRSTPAPSLGTAFLSLAQCCRELISKGVLALSISGGVSSLTHAIETEDEVDQNRDANDS